MVPFYSGFSEDRFIQGSILFRVLWRQVYTGFHFIQGSLETGLYRVPFYSGFSGDRFHCIIFYCFIKQMNQFQLHSNVVIITENSPKR
jgi:hypothetical protein